MISVLSSFFTSISNCLSHEFFLVLFLFPLVIALCSALVHLIVKT